MLNLRAGSFAGMAPSGVRRSPAVQCDAMTVSDAAGPLERFAALGCAVLLLGGSKGAGVTRGREAPARGQHPASRDPRAQRPGSRSDRGTGISGGNARGRTIRSTYHAWQAPSHKRVLAMEVDPVCSAPVDAHGGPPLGAPSRHGYLLAHSHVVMIGVAESHENNARMTRTIYNALANRGYLMTRITHHYSHNVQADASCASRHSRCRI